MGIEDGISSRKEKKVLRFEGSFRISGIDVSVTMHIRVSFLSEPVIFRRVVVVVVTCWWLLD
jgi:hypothetical protein